MYINSGISINNNPDDIKNSDSDSGTKPLFSVTEIVVSEHKNTSIVINGVKPLIPVSKSGPVLVVNTLNIHGDIATPIASNMFIFQRREIGHFQKCNNELGIITMNSGAHIIKPCPIPVLTWVVNIPDAEV